MACLESDLTSSPLSTKIVYSAQNDRVSVLGCHESSTVESSNMENKDSVGLLVQESRTF